MSRGIQLTQTETLLDSFKAKFIEDIALNIKNHEVNHSNFDSCHLKAVVDFDYKTIRDLSANIDLKH